MPQAVKEDPGKDNELIFLKSLVVLAKMDKRDILVALVAEGVMVLENKMVEAVVMGIENLLNFSFL